MKIDIAKTWTVETLTAALADKEGVIAFHRTPRDKSLKPCWCGCGGTTKSRFVPGHDSRFHSTAKKVARGLLDFDEEVAKLPHEDAVAEFERHVLLEVPKFELKTKEKAAAKKVKDDAKAEAKAAKEAAAPVRRSELVGTRGRQTARSGQPHFQAGNQGELGLAQLPFSV